MGAKKKRVASLNEFLTFFIYFPLFLLPPTGTEGTFFFFFFFFFDKQASTTQSTVLTRLPPGCLRKPDIFAGVPLTCNLISYEYFELPVIIKTIRLAEGILGKDAWVQ